jgi:hypothetical protein
MMHRFRLLLILAGALLLAATEAPFGGAPSALADANVVSSHAKVQASGFDGGGTLPPPVTEQDSNFSAFSETISAFDDPNDGRSAEGEATQDTSVDFTDPLASTVDTSGAGTASWDDPEPGDGKDPRAQGRSEFTITFEVTDSTLPFSLVGSIEATADTTNANCTTVTVTSPSGATFGASAPAGCGSSQQSIDESGELSVGTHTFSVVANALASNPNATGGSAEASFDLSLSLDAVAPVIDGAEFTQAIQQLQTLDELQASLGGGPNASNTNAEAFPVTAAGCGDTAVTQWDEASGGNGHSYQAVCSSVTWDEAETALESAGGYLATITSGAENAFVYDLIDDTGFWSLAGDFCPGPFIGGYQAPGSPEPSEGWSWVIGEPFAYANWAQDEPGDSDFANENRMAFGRGDCGPQVATAPVWHDVEANESGVHSYIAEWDVAPVSVEFTQAIQQLQTVSELQADLAGDGEPPVPIVAGKPMAMRVYFADVDEVTDYIVTLSGAASGVKHAALEPGCSPADRRRQENQCSSLTFYFTPPEGQWSVRLKVEPDSAGDVVFDEEFHLTSRKTEALVIKAVSICDGPNVANSCGNANRLQDFLYFMRATFPTADVRVEVTSNQVMRDRSSFADDWAWWVAVRNDVRNIYTAFDSLASISPDQEVYYFGMVRPGGPGTLLGLASVPGRGGVATEFSSTLGVEDSAQSTTHEIGHLLGVKHTNTPNPAGDSFPACYDNAPSETSDWPYADNFLRSGPAPGTVEVGFDVGSQDAKPGDKFFELTGYCNPQWLSQRTYLQMMDALSPTAAPAAVAESVDGPFWLVSGQVDGAVASLEPLLEVETTGSTDTGAGSHRIEVRGAGGQVLFTRHFTPVAADAKLVPGADEGPTTPSFSELIPVQAEAASIVIVDAQSHDIGSIVFGGAASAVTIALPNTFSGVQTLSWSVTDPDSTTHTYAVLYSADAGQTWSVLGMNLSDSSLMIDFAGLPGSAGQALFRVLASDGVNTGSATSQPFTVAGKAPQAEISGPSGGSFRVGDAVWLAASAFDADDGTLDGGSVTWSSSRDGNLGTGASLPVYDLSAGQHTITMTARDGDNNTATDTISITVFDSPVVDVRLVADVDCDGKVAALDGLALLLHLAGLDAGSCKTIGSGTPILFGDVDCDETIGTGDVIAILMLTADLPGGCASPLGRRD